MSHYGTLITVVCAVIALLRLGSGCAAEAGQPNDPIGQTALGLAAASGAPVPVAIDDALVVFVPPPAPGPLHSPLSESCRASWVELSANNTELPFPPR